MKTSFNLASELTHWLQNPINTAPHRPASHSSPAPSLSATSPLSTSNLSASSCCCCCCRTSLVEEDHRPRQQLLLGSRNCRLCPPASRACLPSAELALKRPSWVNKWTNIRMISMTTCTYIQVLFISQGPPWDGMHLFQDLKTQGLALSPAGEML